MVAEDWHAEIRRFGDVLALKYKVDVQFHQHTCMYVWMRPATWLHEMAVPISRSPQRSWWGLGLAEMHPTQWTTLYDILACLFLGRCEIVHACTFVGSENFSRLPPALPWTQNEGRGWQSRSLWNRFRMRRMQREHLENSALWRWWTTKMWVYCILSPPSPPSSLPLLFFSLPFPFPSSHHSPVWRWWTTKCENNTLLHSFLPPPPSSPTPSSLLFGDTNKAC